REMDDFLMPEELDEAEEESCDTAQLSENNGRTSILAGGGLSVSDRSEKYIGQMKELVERYREIKRKTREINELARQLAVGVHLQAELDKCSSERRGFAIQIRLELRFLASGASLLVVVLENISDFMFQNWHLVLGITVLSARPSNGCDALRSFSKSIAVERLAKDKEFICEVLYTEKLIIPLLVRPQFVKRFPLNDNPCIFRLTLESIYFSLWDLVSKASHSSCLPSQSQVVRAVSYRRANEEQALALPNAVVFLLCNERTSENELLKWILPAVDVGDSNCCECFLREEASKVYPLRVEVKKSKTIYEVIVAAKDTVMRAELVTQLQLRVLVKMRHVYKELESKSGCEEILDRSSVTKYFNSFLSRFSS
uniref:NAD(P)-binding domain-containing protein n=2 Tax=Parascaris univalens TaxID=6257 RepID=A0A915C5Y4_PARUN